MTTLYLVSNNYVINNVLYPKEMNDELKRASRPLSIKGQEVSKVFIEDINYQDIDVLYASNYASAIETLKYISNELGLSINIDSGLNERKIGNYEFSNLNSYKESQEHDFDYHIAKGESINDVKKRVSKVLDNIVKEYEGRNILVATHNVAIMSYLLNFCHKGYNLDDRLVLDYQGTIVMDSSDNGLLVLKLVFDNPDLESITKL